MVRARSAGRSRRASRAAARCPSTRPAAGTRRGRPCRGSSVAPAGASSSTASKSTPPTPIGRAGRHPQHLGPAAQVQQDGRRVAGVGDGDPVRRPGRTPRTGRSPCGRVPSRWACSSRWCRTSCGGRSSPARVCAVVRSWPMIAARRHGVPHDVADDERDPAAGQRDRVVPVTADAGRLGGGQVAGRQPHTRGLRQGLRQHRALQLVGDVGLAAVQHRLVDAERGVGGELGGDQQIVRLERGPLRAAQEQRGADDPAPAAQRGEDRALAVRYLQVAGLAEQFGQGRAGGGRVREDGPDAAQHLGERAAGTHLAQFGADRGQFGRLRRERRRWPGSRSRCPGPAAAGRCGAAAAPAGRWAARRRPAAGRADRRGSRRRTSARWPGTAPARSRRGRCRARYAGWRRRRTAAGRRPDASAGECRRGCPARNAAPCLRGRPHPGRRRRRVRSRSRGSPWRGAPSCGSPCPGGPSRRPAGPGCCPAPDADGAPRARSRTAGRAASARARGWAGGRRGWGRWSRTYRCQCPSWMPSRLFPPLFPLFPRRARLYRRHRRSRGSRSLSRGRGRPPVLRRPLPALASASAGAAPPPPGNAEAPRGCPRGCPAGRCPADCARARWVAPSRVSNPSVRGCALYTQLVPPTSRYPEYVPQERKTGVVRGCSWCTGRPWSARTDAALVRLAHVLPPLGDVWSGPAHVPVVTVVRPCGGRSYGCAPGAHQGSHDDMCAGVRSQSSGSDGTAHDGSGRQCCQPSANGAPQARITSTAARPASRTRAASRASISPACWACANSSSSRHSHVRSGIDGDVEEVVLGVDPAGPTGKRAPPGSRTSS